MFSARKIRSLLVFLIVQQAHRLSLNACAKSAKKMISLRDKSLLTKRAAKYTLLASAVSLPTRRAISLIEIGFWISCSNHCANSGLLPASFAIVCFHLQLISPSAVAAAIIVRKINSPASTWL